MPTQEPTAWELAAHALKKLRFLIDANHETVPRMAESMGISRETLLDVLDGVVHPTESFVRKCADHFGVSYEFMTGQETPRKSAGAKGRSPGGAPAEGGAVAERRPATPPTAAASGDDARGEARPTATLTVRTVATRVQALVELLVEKGVMTPREYQEKVREVEDRAR